MKILAIDPGSTVCAWAHFDGEHMVSTVRCKPRAALTWLERMETIAEALVADHNGPAVPVPDFVAIEETLAYSASVRNASELARGYLVRVITHDVWPGLQLVEVNLTTIRRSLGLKGNAKREIRQSAARERFPGISQDEADACAVALGALLLAQERAQQG